MYQGNDCVYEATKVSKPSGANVTKVDNRPPFAVKTSGSTCTGPHEFCCEAPAGDPNNCPDSARTSDCDKKGACCCAFLEEKVVKQVMDTCTGPHEFCCEAPNKDPNNCPASARTSDCDKKGACC